jgi:hypothetical protein
MQKAQVMTVSEFMAKEKDVKSTKRKVIEFSAGATIGFVSVITLF